jgi:hypothetical protein
VTHREPNPALYNRVHRVSIRPILAVLGLVLFGCRPLVMLAFTFMQIAVLSPIDALVLSIVPKITRAIMRLVNFGFHLSSSLPIHRACATTFCVSLGFLFSFEVTVIITATTEIPKIKFVIDKAFTPSIKINVIHKLFHLSSSLVISIFPLGEKPNGLSL